MPNSTGRSRVLAGKSLGGIVRWLAVLFFCAGLAACTTTDIRKAGPEAVAKPAPNSRGVLIQPDVQLSLLTAAGIQERREDWNRDAQQNLVDELKAELASRSHPFEVIDPQTSMQGRTGQLLRLHEAVGQSIMIFEYGGLKLPTKKGAFDWTLGDGTLTLRDSLNADYALFVTARGSYASGGRKALMAGAALFGVSVPLGSQRIFASLVDLRTGQVVWFNVAVAGPSADMRSPDGARLLVADLLKGLPV